MNSLTVDFMAFYKYIDFKLRGALSTDQFHARSAGVT